jgi:hypothetical protein
MKIIDKIKRLMRPRPATEEKLVARADVEAVREHARNEVAGHYHS